MATKRLFEPVGIKPPGKVHTMQFGEIKLYEVGDDVLKTLYESGCSYIRKTTACLIKETPGGGKFTQKRIPKKKKK